MKPSSIFAALLLALITFSFAPNHAAKNLDLEKDLLCGATLVTGCVGACGTLFKEGAVAPVTGTYCFEATSSLCPTNGTLTILKRNGTTLFTGDASGGISFNFPASAGDQITIASKLTNKKSNAVCIWLGEVNVTVRMP